MGRGAGFGDATEINDLASITRADSVPTFLHSSSLTGQSWGMSRRSAAIVPGRRSIRPSGSETLRWGSGNESGGKGCAAHGL